MLATPLESSLMILASLRKEIIEEDLSREAPIKDDILGVEEEADWAGFDVFSISI